MQTSISHPLTPPHLPHHSKPLFRDFKAFSSSSSLLYKESLVQEFTLRLFLFFLLLHVTLIQSKKKYLSARQFTVGSRLESCKLHGAKKGILAWIT